MRVFKYLFSSLYIYVCVCVCVCVCVSSSIILNVGYDSSHRGYTSMVSIGYAIYTIADEVSG